MKQPVSQGFEVVTRPQKALPSGALLASAAEHLALAALRSRQGRLDEAVRAYRACLAEKPQDRAAWSGLALALQRLGNRCGAIEAWQSLLALDPGSWYAENDLGALFMEAGQWDCAEACFARAAAVNPPAPIVLLNRAMLAARRGDRAHSILQLQACVQANPSYAAGHAGLGLALRDQGRFDAAAVALEAACALAPDDATYACSLGRVYLEAGAAERASEQAKAFLSRRPGHSGALALEALARIALADTRALAQLLDYSGLVFTEHLSTPDGFADLQSFNAALAAHVAEHPTLVSAPASHATAQGLLSGSLLVDPRGPVAFLEQAISGLVAAYARGLSTLTDHPLSAQRPSAVFLKMWGVVLRRGGHQIPHVHPAAWLSGVYYPKLPRAIQSGDGPAGWLEFGRPDREFPSRLPSSEWPVHRVRPEEGLIVLFPSYFYHRTIPFDGEGTRVSVPFDVVPL